MVRTQVFISSSFCNKSRKVALLSTWSTATWTARHKERTELHDVAGVHNPATHARRHRRHSPACTRPPVLRTGSAGRGSQCLHQSRALPWSAVELGDPAAHPAPGTILLRLDLSHGHTAAFRRQHAFGVETRQATHRFKPLQTLANAQVCRADRRPH